jgi:hypothetical protein
MEELDNYRQELLSALKDVVNELSQTVSSIPANDWYVSLGLDGHTPHYILAHLQVLEAQVFAIQLRRIVEEDTPLLPFFDDNAWMAENYDSEKPAQVIWEEFANLRNQEVKWLQNFSPKSWNRAARHPRWGMRTLQWWVELQLDYSHQHLRELASLLGV